MIYIQDTYINISHITHIRIIEKFRMVSIFFSSNEKPVTFEFDTSQEARSFAESLAQSV